MTDELYYRIALTMIPELGPVCAKLLVENFGDARAVFKARKKEIGMVAGIGELRAKYLKDWNGFAEVEKEIAFLHKYGIRPLFITDREYPQRLLHCYDPPTLLYYRGNTDLNTVRIISIIGTRNHTEYGRMIAEQLIMGMAPFQVIIVSGLAFGIDAIAHRTALQQGLSTIGVLAHGMDTLYPAQHKALAKEMIQQGGLLTEFRKSEKPDKHNFPKRNRIVAGMSDATIVIETAVKGGSMITAELAHNYNRDLFAVPGRISDPKSSGCLTLISQNKAVLLTNAEQLVETMGWEEKKKKPRNRQKEMFIELSPDEKIIVGLLQEKETMAVDELYFRSMLSSSSVAAAILNLELQNMISAMPGKIYRLL
jgi:DNA processing protein